MEMQFKDNGTAQLLMPLLGRVPAFPKGERELQFPSGFKEAGGTRVQNLCSDLLGSGSGVAKKLTHVNGHLSLLPWAAALEKRSLVGNL